MHNAVLKVRMVCSLLLPRLGRDLHPRCHMCPLQASSCSSESHMLLGDVSADLHRLLPCSSDDALVAWLVRARHQTLLIRSIMPETLLSHAADDPDTYICRGLSYMTCPRNLVTAMLQHCCSPLTLAAHVWINGF